MASVDGGGLVASQDLTSADAFNYDLAGDGNGDAIAVWSEQPNTTSQTLNAAMRPPGGSFAAPTTVAFGSGALGAPIRAAMNARGDAVIVYSAYTNTGSIELRAVFRPAGGKFGAPVAVATIPGSQNVTQARVALDDGGSATGAWVVSDAIEVVRGTQSGFEPPQTFSGNGTQLADPHLAVDARGDAVLAWRTDTSFGQTVSASLRPAGGQFGAAQDLAMESYSNKSFDATLAPTGAASVAVVVDGPNSGGSAGVVVSGDVNSGTFGSRRYLGYANTVALGTIRDGSQAIAWDIDGRTRALVRDAAGNESPPRDIYCGDGTGASDLPYALVDPAGGAAVLRTHNGPSIGPPTLLIRTSLSQPAGAQACARPSPPMGIPLGFFIPYDPMVQLLTPPAHSATDSLRAPWSNGASADLAFSQDNRNARLVAFDSLATNLVPGDTNGTGDVFVFHRDSGGGVLTGTLERVSVASAGGQANGVSSHPSVDGDGKHAPHCVAFESRATNLDPRDTGPDSDIFLRDLASRRTTLLSPGIQEAHKPVVDGGCTSVTFEANGFVYVTATRHPRPLRLARGNQPDQQTNGHGVAYVRGGQIWYRFFIVRGGRVRIGRERLVSDDRRGRRGNGRSSHPSLDDAGRYVAFESGATNLCVHRCRGVSTDANGHTSDVFRRTLSRFAPTHDSMEMVSYSFKGHTQGNGPSNDPQISAGGENVVFDSAATNFKRRELDLVNDLNGPTRDIFSWIFPAKRGYGDVVRVDKPRCIRFACPAASIEPALSSRGNYLAYRSVMAEFCGPSAPHFDGDRPCPGFTDVFIRFVGYSHEGYPLG